MKDVKILNVKVDNVSFDEAVKKAEAFLDSGKQNYIITPNPEIISYAKKDDHYRQILNLADLSIPDGFGLQIASLFQVKHRVTGIDLMTELLTIAENKGLKVYGIIKKGGFSTKEEIYNALLKKYPNLKVELRYSGEGEVEEMIARYEPKMIFVGLGFPDQEKWIAHHLRKFGFVEIFMGVGGSFDFLAGKTKRAPKWMRESGLEWLWRLVRHPDRIGRIFNAVVIFPLKVFLSKK
ncbi:WecB/TagA/CpsF family glycosyltransferase [Patescibacteria group bacterium]|nr:WecB/TagA/CpsF family glycosyltransferase [Patescibacteria group bacterium]MBU1673579.1 WecB/TagA/CpsF family glycosyltransferase [Patescibacteria group bacterium]MBU1963481.1 WecB/TagA/CpsF family glycosyltransferase [Patescibacteria group bacterium]